MSKGVSQFSKFKYDERLFSYWVSKLEDENNTTCHHHREKKCLWAIREDFVSNAWYRFVQNPHQNRLPLALSTKFFLKFLYHILISTDEEELQNILHIYLRFWQRFDAYLISDICLKTWTYKIKLFDSMG